MPQCLRRMAFFLTCFQMFLVSVPLICFSCIVMVQTSVVAADIDGYEAARYQMTVLESLENREEKKAGYDVIIANFRDNENLKVQRLVARAMRECAVAEYDPDNREDRGEERVVAKLDEMIAKYKTSESDDIKIEVIAAMQTKASLYSWPSKLANEEAEGSLLDEIIAAVGDASNETMQRMAAHAMFRKQYCVSWADGEEKSVLWNLVRRFSSSDDLYVKKIVAESLDRLAERVSTEEEKNTILKKILAAYQSDEDTDIQAIVTKARKGITPEGSFDAGAANSLRFASDEEINSALRQAWRCKTPMEKYDLYSDIIKKYRHMKRDKEKVGVFTALIERSFLDMTSGNEMALAYFDDFAAKASDYGAWLLVSQNRLWFVRGRENILAELDKLLDPARKSKFASNQPEYSLLATISSQKIDAILDWAQQLKSSLSQWEKPPASSQASTIGSGRDNSILRDEAISSDDFIVIPSILERILNEYGDNPGRLTQYNLSRAMENEAALLDEGMPKKLFWRSVVDRFKPERSVYARHHVIAGYAKLIAMTDGEEKNILLGELVEQFDKDGTFQELLLLEDIRTGKTDFPMPLLFRDW